MSSIPLPAYGPMVRPSRSILQIWCNPAIAMYRSPLWIQRSQGLAKLVPRGDVPARLGATRACFPLPAIVSTRRWPKSTLRIRWFSVSATYNMPSCQAKPCGWLNSACSKAPSALPCLPLPTTSDNRPCRSAITMRLWPLSAMKICWLPASARIFPGNLKGVRVSRWASRSKVVGFSSSAFAPVSRDGGLKEAVQLFEGDFALVVSDQIAFRIDHPQRRPHVDRVPLPQHQLRIIHHGMSDARTEESPDECSLPPVPWQTSPSARRSPPANRRISVRASSTPARCACS